MKQVFELTRYIKIKHWRYSWETKPVLFALDKIGLTALLLLIPAQFIYFLLIGIENFSDFQQIPLVWIWVICLGINLSQLMYFPGRCATQIGKGTYYRYPVSWQALNGIRLLEGLGTKSFLLSCNVMVLPLMVQVGNTIPFVACFILIMTGIRMASFLMYDTIWLVIGRALWLATAILLLIAGYWLINTFAESKSALNGLISFNLLKGNLVVTGLLGALFFLADPKLLYQNTVNRKFT